MSAETSHPFDDGQPPGFVVEVQNKTVTFSTENAVLKTFKGNNLRQIAFFDDDGAFGVYFPSNELFDAMVAAGHEPIHTTTPDSTIIGSVGRIVVSKDTGITYH